MKLNKFGLLALSTIALFSCDPLKDTYEQLDKDFDPNAQVVKTMDEYILTAADYATISKTATSAAKQLSGEDSLNLVNAAKLVASENALNAIVNKSDYIPAIVAKLVPSWQNGSVVNVTYNFSDGLTESEKEYSNIANLAIKECGDYDFFYPSCSPENNVPVMLEGAYPDAVENDKVVVEYKYSATDPVVEGHEEVFVSADFEDQTAYEAIAIEGWKNIDLKGESTFTCMAYSGAQYAQVSPYGSTGDVDIWMITPSFDVDENTSMTFDMKYGVAVGDEILDVLVSESYDGSDAIDATQWVSIKELFDYPAMPESGYSKEWGNVGSVKLADYVGKKINVAFRYEGNSETASTKVQIDNFKIASGYATVTSEEKPVNALYEFDGIEWSVVEGVNLISPEDYDSMGEPGKYDNFSSSVLPSDYIPAYLAGKYSYAVAGETQVVIYKIYSGGSRIEADEYIFDGASWSVNSNISVCEREVFIKAGGAWMFDPTLAYAITVEDYTAIVEWVAENKPEYMDTEHGNSEFFYGANYYFKNFRVDLVKRRSYDPEGILTNMNDAEAATYLDNQVYESIMKFVLAPKYGDVPAINAAGGEQIIKVDCLVYNGQTITYRITFKVVEPGKFEFVEKEEIL